MSFDKKHTSDEELEDRSILAYHDATSASTRFFEVATPISFLQIASLTGTSNAVALNDVEPATAGGTNAKIRDNDAVPPDKEELPAAGTPIQIFIKYLLIFIGFTVTHALRYSKRGFSY